LTLKNLVPPEERRAKLKKKIETKKIVRVMEAHNGISALIASNALANTKTDQQKFDALWSSSLTDSAARGVPDIELGGFEARMNSIRQILSVTSLPLIVDGDTGGDASNFEYLVHTLEDLGVSAIVIEDKVFPKRNSLSQDATQTLEDPDIFANKIKRGKSVQISKDFMIFARLESLIAGTGMEDALIRARKYLEAGADGILVHSKSKDPAEIFCFSKAYEKLCKETGSKKPLACVPTTYNTVTCEELEKNGFSIAIFANQQLRACAKTMKETCEKILAKDRAFEAEPLCAPVKDIFEIVGFLDVTKKDALALKNKKDIPVIIPNSGDDPVLQKILLGNPKAMIKIAGKTIIQRQIETLKCAGFQKIFVIRGSSKGKILAENVNFIENTDFKNTHILKSLFLAKEHIEKGFIYLNGDVLFEKEIIEKTMNFPGDIVLTVDDSFAYHKHELEKKLDLVVCRGTNPAHRRRFHTQTGLDVTAIGKKIGKEHATHEFVGIAKFSAEGVKELISVFEDSKKNSSGKFHEAESFELASFTDIIQEMIERGYGVKAVEINKGWIEIHNEEDILLAKKIVGG
jgi:phosphoenolpyruvate mutase